MVTDEIRAFEEEKRIAISPLDKPSSVPGRNEQRLSQGSFLGLLMSIELLALTFLIRSTYDLLPTPVNSKKWGLQQND